MHATPETWRTRTRVGAGDWTTHESERNLTTAEFRNWALEYALESTFTDDEFTYTGSADGVNTTVYRVQSTAYRGDRFRGRYTLHDTVTSAGATLLVDEPGQSLALENWYSGPTRALTDTGDQLLVNATVRYQWSFRTVDETTSSDWSVADGVNAGGYPEPAFLTHRVAGTAMPRATATRTLRNPFQRSAASGRLSRRESSPVIKRTGSRVAPVALSSGYLAPD